MIPGRSTVLLALSLGISTGLVAQAKPKSDTAKPKPMTAQPAARPATPPAPATAAKVAKPAVKSEPLDINTATRDQLVALPAIGEAYADKIIAGRPYATKNQLVSKNVLPRNVYTKVSKLIVAKKKAG